MITRVGAGSPARPSRSLSGYIIETGVIYVFFGFVLFFVFSPPRGPTPGLVRVLLRERAYAPVPLSSDCLCQLVQPATVSRELPRLSLFSHRTRSWRILSDSCASRPFYLPVFPGSLARAARAERVARVVRPRRQKRHRSRGRRRRACSSRSDVYTDSSSRGCTPTSVWVRHRRCTRRRSSST